MISINGLYSIIRNAILEITDVQVYQNPRSSLDVVGAKWLFVKFIYLIFDKPDAKIIHLTKPTQSDLAFQLGYKNHNSVWFLHKKYIPTSWDKKNYARLKVTLKEYLEEEAAVSTEDALAIQREEMLLKTFFAIIAANDVTEKEYTIIGNKIKAYTISRKKGVFK